MGDIDPLTGQLVNTIFGKPASPDSNRAEDEANMLFNAMNEPTAEDPLPSIPRDSNPEQNLLQLSPDPPRIHTPETTPSNQLLDLDFDPPSQ